MDASIFTVFQRKRVHVKVLTMTHDKGDMGPTKGESTPVSEYKMPSFQRMLSILTSNSTNLRIQISELNQLREQLRKALQSAQSGGRECELNVQHIPEGG